MWAGLDSNQRPSGYEPPALTPELPAPWPTAVYPCPVPTLRRALPILLAALIALACAPAPQPQPPANPPAAPNLADWLDLPNDIQPVHFPWTPLTIQTADRRIELGVFIADTPARRQRGLMYANGLPPANAMLFIFENPPVRSGFWNHNVPIDLNVAFLDAEGRILEIITLEAQSRQTKRPTHPYTYALEVPAGRYTALGIQIGHRLIINSDAIPSN